MWPLIPIFMSLLNIVTTKTEPMDFSDVGMSDSINRGKQKDIFSSRTDSMNSHSSDYLRFNELAGHRRKINLNNDKNDDEDWNERETRLYEDPLKLRKIIAHEDIDEDAFDDYEDSDEAAHSIDEFDETDLNRLTIFLTKLLQQPSWQAPLIIVNEPPFSDESEETELRPNVWKRSRGYRRYPWKRQNSRSRHVYDYDTAYYCMPSRDDVFQLLVALHNVRQGDRLRNVHFCNRQRSAGTLFTNIRFLGRRK